MRYTNDPGEIRRLAETQARILQLAAIGYCPLSFTCDDGEQVKGPVVTTRATQSPGADGRPRYAFIVTLQRDDDPDYFRDIDVSTIAAIEGETSRC